MAENEDPKGQGEAVGFQHQGDHHLAKVQVGAGNKVSAGVVSNFSNNASAMFAVVDGKVQGALTHAGDTHTLHIDAKADGTFSGSYTDEKAGIVVEFKDGIANLVKGKMPPSGISVKGEHHNLSLTQGPDGKLRGSIESKKVPNGIFKLEVDGGRVSGGLVFKGDSHETSVSLGAGGSWKAGLGFKVGGGKLSFTVEKGKGVKGGVGFQLPF